MLLRILRQEQALLVLSRGTRPIDEPATTYNGRLAAVKRIIRELERVFEAEGWNPIGDDQ